MFHAQWILLVRPEIGSVVIILYEVNKMINKEDCIFFWSGIFSNFHPINGDGLTSEHLYMNAKALYFGDKETAAQIMSAPKPRDAKKLGRKVQGYNDSEWADVRFEVMVSVLTYKYFVCSEFSRELVISLPKMLVEASPSDCVWGIGMAEENPNITDDSKWGQNLLGKALMEVRRKQCF